MSVCHYFFVVLWFFRHCSICIEKIMVGCDWQQRGITCGYQEIGQIEYTYASERCTIVL